MDTRFEALEERMVRSEDGVRRLETGQIELQRSITDISRMLHTLTQDRDRRDGRREEGSGSHNGGGGGNDTRTEQEKKLELPLFSCENVQDWLARAERYFTVNHITDEEKLPAVLIVLEGEALHWYQWWERTLRETSWDLFRTDDVGRFRPELVGDPFRELFRLKQTGTIREYRRDFERISSSVHNIDEVFLRGIWLNGVIDSIREELLLKPNDSLEKMMQKVQRIESKNLALANEVNGGTGSDRGKGPYYGSQTCSFTQTSNASVGQNQFRPISSGVASSVSNPEASKHVGQNWSKGNTMGGGSFPRGESSGGTNRTTSRRLPQAELQDRSRRGMCFHCDERWSPTHRCRNRQLHLLIVDDGEEELEEGLGTQGEVVRDTPEAETLLQLSSQSLMGLSSSRTMQMWGSINGSEVVVLIDCGASHNFIKHSVVELLKLHVEDTPKYQVEVGNG